MPTTARRPNPEQLLNNQFVSLCTPSLSMTKLYKPLLDKLQLTYPSTWYCWCCGNKMGPVFLNSVRLQLDSGTLTPLLKRMEAAGWVQRLRSSVDERKVHVCLTDVGRDLQTRAAHIPGCVARQSGIGLDALTSLRDQLQRLRLALNP